MPQTRHRSTRQNRSIFLLLATSAMLAGLPLVGPLSAADKPMPTARWTFTKGTAGWKAVRDCRLEVADGVLTIHCTGRDPHLVTQVAVKDGWHRLTLRARFQGRMNAQIFWGTEAEASFSEARSEQFQLRAGDDDWHDYHVFFHTDSDLVQLRLDPGNRKTRVQLAAITLERRKPAAPQATAEQAGHGA